MRGQTQHDQIGIGSAQHMLRIGVMVRLSALATNVIHDFVFSLARHIGIRENHLDVFPAGVIVQTIVNVVLETLGEAIHKWGSGSDAVAVKV